MSRRYTPLAWVLLALLGLGAAQDCGSIVSRGKWGTLASRCSQRLRQPVRYVVVSHTAGSVCNTPASCQRQAQNVQYYHVRERGWCDVGYK